MSQSDRAKALIKDMEARFGAGIEHEGHNEGSGGWNSYSEAHPSGQIRPALRIHRYEKEAVNP